MHDDERSGPTALRGMTWDHPRGVDGLRAAGPAILERLRVTIEWESRSLLAFGDQHISDFAGEFDLMVIDHPHVPDGARAGALLRLDEHLPSGVLATLQRESVGASHDSYGYAGHHWALAVDAAAQVSAFRPDLADGVPPYWSDVLELARAGRVIWPYKPVDAFSTFATLLAQHGAPLAHPDRFLDRDAAAKVLDFMIELAAHVPDWCAGANPIDAAEALVSDGGFSTAVALFGYTNYSRAGFRERRIAYDDIPSFDGRAGGSTLGGAGIAVSASTAHPALAAAVAAALAGAHVQSGVYSAGGGQPGNLRAWRSEAQNELTGGFYRNTLRTHERAWVRPRVLGWPDLQLELSRIVHESLVARAVAPDALDRLELLPAQFLKESIA
jgi:multiple sugar transport system substrate-binding protein